MTHKRKLKQIPSPWMRAARRFTRSNARAGRTLRSGRIGDCEYQHRYYVYFCALRRAGVAARQVGDQ